MTNLTAESDRKSVFAGKFGCYFNWTMAFAAACLVVPFAILLVSEHVDPSWGRGGLGQFAASVAFIALPIIWLVLVVVGFSKFRTRAFWLLMGLPIAGLYWMFALPCMMGVKGCL